MVNLIYQSSLRVFWTKEIFFLYNWGQCDWHWIASDGSCDINIAGIQTCFKWMHKPNYCYHVCPYGSAATIFAKI